MFADRARIIIRSGKGGDGHVSFRREKFVANGGPDGGDGGNGGSVYFEVDEGLNTLFEFRHTRKYSAQDGEQGGKRNCRGKDGEDIVIRVPEGTVIKDVASGKIIADMSGENKRLKILTGGKGGNGNQHYATPTMQVPKYGQPGQPAKEIEVFLELKVIADVGLVGFPNVGKSTFLSCVSNARPKIANYHFTTLQPNLGFVDMHNGDGFIIADIPGLIEGASEGAGLGYEFLRHIERTRVMIHIIDAAGSEGRDPFDDVYKINNELKKYNADISARPQVIAANKLDLLLPDEAEQIVNKLKVEFEPQGFMVYPMSAATRSGIDDILKHVQTMLNGLSKERVVFESEYDPDHFETNREPIEVWYDEESKQYFIEGPGIEKMLGFTNLDSEKGFAFFQNFLKERGVLDKLEALGINEGDTVRMYGWAFDYYKN